MFTSKFTAILCVILFVTYSKTTFSQSPNSGAFTFKLLNSSRTSAGVYKTDSTLVRTLWADSTFSAGTYTRYWDGKDDNGKPIASPDPNYVIKVLSNNVSYNWDGVIGNTSSSQTGMGVHRGTYTSMIGMAITGTTAYFCQGYSEGYPSEAKFSTTNPQVRLNVYSGTTATMNSEFVVTDGTNVYWAGFDAFTSVNSFVHVTKVIDDTEVSFGANGSKYAVTYGKVYNSIIDKVVTNSHATGLAVQPSGSYLFVSHGSLNQLHVFNKATGALVQNITVTNPRGIATEGSSLWMVSATNTVAKYNINANGTLSAATLTLSGISTPGAIAANGGNIAIIDAGTNQIVRFYNTTSGAQGTQLGTTGGYATSPNVSNSKFMFGNYVLSGNSFLAYAPDGSFWVGDGGNYREQHYSASKTYIETVMSMGATYSVCADPNNINRVFGNYLEFNVDYTKPLTGSTGWTLVKNWGFGGATVNKTLNKLLNVVTLSNGRTYGYDYYKGFAELTSTGMRYTGTSLNGVLCKDGSVQRTTGRQDSGSNLIVTKYPLTGFDGSNNPQWSSTGIMLATTPTNTNQNPNTTPVTDVLTSNNKVIFYTTTIKFLGTTKPQNGYHLGAIKKGQTQWLWKTANATFTNYQGKFPAADRFDVGNGVNDYAGSMVNVMDNNVITGYHGEFWKQGETNWYNHYLDDGLPIGQFGTDGASSSPFSAAKNAGNALTISLIKENSTGNLYLYHGDESQHSGVHRWKISNLSSISEQYITVPFPSSYKAPIITGYVDLHAGLPYNATLATQNGWSKTGTVSYYSNRKKYVNDGSPDVFAVFAPPYTTTSGVASVQRDLGTNNVTSNWKINGQISFQGSQFLANGNKVYLDVLDGAGKILARFYWTSGYAPFPTVFFKLFGNNAIISTDANTVSNTLAALQPYEVKCVNGLVTFSYGSYPAVSTSIFDGSANWRQPKTLRAYVAFGNPSSAIQLNLLDMKLYKDYTNTISKTLPVANAGIDTTIVLPSNSYTISGSGSYANGNITNYSWQKVMGPASGTITNSNNVTSDVTSLIQGIYNFELKITDNNGDTDVDTVQITIDPPANLSPIANAGADKTIALPTNSVAIIGSGTDADGTISTYLWAKISGPSVGTITNTTSAVTSMTSLVQGVYLFELKVTDNQGATASDTLQVSVNVAGNIPPVSNAGADKTITLPINSVSIAGSGTDPDGTISNYTWAKISGPSAGTITNTTSAVTSTTSLVQGVYLFELKVTDNQGAIVRDTMIVTVNAAGNIPPIANAGPDQKITLPVNIVSVAGSGGDADGTIVGYLWTKISGPSSYNIVNASSPVTDISGLVNGIYNFQLEVIDNSGVTGKDTIQVTINTAANIPPVANAGKDTTVKLPANTASLSGLGSDSDGSIASYSWTKISGPSSYNIVDATSPATNVTGLVLGTYLFGLKVTDNDGAIAEDTMQLTVIIPGNIPPVADAGKDQFVSLPKNNLQLLGSGTDPDGTVMTYLWTKISGPASGVIASANYPATPVIILVQGVYLFQLIVTDNKGAVGRDTMVVTVSSASLPLKLLSFNAKLQNDKVDLSWETTNEKNVSGFDIEKMNGDTWDKIGFVASSSTNVFSNHYNSIDDFPLKGINYYRLRIVDIDGKFVYSNIINVDVKPNRDFVYQNFPNPFPNVTNIKFEIAEENLVKIIVYNALGVQVKVLVNEIKQPGVYQVEWKTENIAPGNYYYNVIIDHNIVTKKMLKLH